MPPRRGQLVRALGNRLREFAEPLGELRHDAPGRQEAVLESGVLVVNGLELPHFAADHITLVKDFAASRIVKVDGDAAGNDAVHQQAMAEQLRVEPNPVFLEAHELHQAEGQSNVVAKIAEVAEMIGDALAFEQQRA